jgi:replicative DNA helicase
MSNDLPSNIDAETWLLGSVFQDPKIMAQFADELSPADFYHEKNQMAWQAMKLLQKKNEPIDIVSVANNIKIAGAFDSLFKNNDYLFFLQEAVSSGANADYYAELIKDCASKRKLIEACNKTLREAMSPAFSANECLENALESIGGIAKKSCRAVGEHIGESSWNLIKEIERSKTQSLPFAVQTSFGDVDHLIGGLRKKELVIVGARPGVGKTSFALDVAINAAVKHGPALMFSLEMSPDQLSARAMCYYSKVSLRKTIDAHLDMEEMGRQKSAASLLLQNVPLVSIYDKGLTARQISAIAHFFAAKKPLSLVVIDHLQIVNFNPERKSYENRNIAIGEATRIFREIAGKLNCCVMVLSQLNRDSEKSEGKKTNPPRLSDLRDSGNIEQDADCVMLMHRLTKDSDFRSAAETDIIVAKNRSGPTGETKIHFNAENAMFTGLNDYLFD